MRCLMMVRRRLKTITSDSLFPIKQTINKANKNIETRGNKTANIMRKYKDVGKLN